VHLLGPLTGAQRSLITSVPNELTRTPFPNIVSTRLPLQETRFALNAGDERPTPTRSYVPNCPGNPVRVTRPSKYYHNTSSIGRGNRQLPLSRARIGSVKPIAQGFQRQPGTCGNANLRASLPFRLLTPIPRSAVTEKTSMSPESSSPAARRALLRLDATPFDAQTLLARITR
jgi:hypothetical protein